MIRNNDQALEFMKQAEKKLKPRLSNLFKTRGEQLEEAEEFYVKAGNIYRMNKYYNEATNAYSLASECSLEAGNRYDASISLLNIAKMIHTEKPEESIEYYLQAIELFIDEGRFNIVAKYQMIVAEQYEKINDLDKAISSYELAIDYFSSEHNNANKNKCLRKIGDISTHLGKYEYAIKKYEEIIRNSLDNNLLKWGTKELYVCATICHLANGDTVSAKLALDKYCNWDPSFNSTMELQFLSTICTAIDNYDTDMFVDAIIKYDSLGKLDNMTTSLLLKIKKQIVVNDEDDGLA